MSDYIPDWYYSSEYQSAIENAHDVGRRAGYVHGLRDGVYMMLKLFRISKHGDELPKTLKEKFGYDTVTELVNKHRLDDVYRAVEDYHYKVEYRLHVDDDAVKKRQLLHDMVSQIWDELGYKEK